METNPTSPTKPDSPRRANSIFRAAAIAATLLTLGAATAWILDWTTPRPVPMSGGLYFPFPVSISAPHFLQADPAWAADPLGPTSETLAQSGCAVASAAMALASRGVDTDPARLNSFLADLPGGYTPEGWIYWEKAAEIDPTLTPALLPHYEDAPSHFLIDTNLLLGNPVIARVRYTNGITHFVLITGKHGFDYTILDPGEGGKNGPTLLTSLPPPVEAIRFYKKP